MSGSRLPLEHVITTAELDRRPSRQANYEIENAALVRLMEAMAAERGADGILQNLVEAALELCHAHSAGASVLEKDENGAEVFRWRSAAGQWSIHCGEVMPRESPSGTVLDRNTALLMTHPERHYSYPQYMTFPIAEALLIPFYLHGEPVGVIWIIAQDETRRFDAEDRRLMTSLARFAATAYQLWKQEGLSTELAATERLQQISTQLLGENDLEALYQKIVDAAAVIMHSHFASIQMHYPERGPRGELRLLAHRGFNPATANFWEWVRSTSESSCGAALRSAKRVIIADLEAHAFTSDSGDLEAYRQAGIRAVQSTPLVSRGAQMLGMLSTHWRHAHQPSRQDLRLLDILARQAADLIERSLAQQHTQLLLREVSHRAKNMLAVVQAIAQQTATVADPVMFAQQFSDRLAGIASSHDLLVENKWRGVDAGDLIRSQLFYLGDLVGTRVTMNGPPVRLAAAAAQPVGMALHELATNAVKYGALSNEKGTVAVKWNVVADGDQPRFLMSWIEGDGPPVTAPQRQGFGQSVIMRSIEHALDATVSLDYARHGLDWRVDAPATAVLEDASKPTLTGEI